MTHACRACAAAPAPADPAPQPGPRAGLGAGARGGAGGPRRPALGIRVWNPPPRIPHAAERARCGFSLRPAAAGGAGLRKPCAAGAAPRPLPRCCTRGARAVGLASLMRARLVCPVPRSLQASRRRWRTRGSTLRASRARRSVWDGGGLQQTATVAMRPPSRLGHAPPAPCRRCTPRLRLATNAVSTFPCCALAPAACNQRGVHPFLRPQMRAIQRLMGALCFARRAAAGRPNPYADLMAEDLWGNLGAAPLF